MRAKRRVERVAIDVGSRLRASFEGEELGRRYMYKLSGLDDSQIEKRLNELREQRDDALMCYARAQSDPVFLDPGGCAFRYVQHRVGLMDSNVRGTSFFLFNDNLYAASGPFTTDEFSRLVREEFDMERKFFERPTGQQSESTQSRQSGHRERIPEEVRFAVWRRDGGKCSRCGTRERLEYDHIVPVSKGGSSTVRNIELLCEKCNRSKGCRIQ